MTKRIFWILLAGIGTLLLCASPFLSADFGIHNDYLIFGKVFSPIFGKAVHAETHHLMFIGRPLNAILFDLHQSLIHSVRDMLWSRLVSILLLCLAFALTALGCRRQHHDFPRAALASLAMFLLPSSVLFMVWDTNLVPGPFTITLALTAYLLLNAPAGTGKKFWQPVSALLLLVCAVLIYPPSALFFLVPCVWHLAWEENLKRAARNTLSHSGLALLGLILGFLLIKWLLPAWYAQQGWTEYLATWDNQRYSQDIFNTTLLEKGQLVAELIYVVLNLWNILLDSTLIALPVVMLATILLLVGLLPHQRVSWQGFLAEWGWRLLLFLLLFLTTISPVVVAPHGFVAYRLLLAAAASVVAVVMAGLFRLLDWSGGKRKRVGQALMLAGMMVVSVHGLWTALLIRANAVREWEFVLAEIDAIYQRRTDGKDFTLIVRYNPEGVSYIPIPLSYDLGYLASNHGVMISIFKCAQQYLGIQSSGNIKVLQSEEEGTYPPLPPAEYEEINFHALVDEFSSSTSRITL